MAVSEAQKKASEKYKKENMKQYKLMLSLKYDTDIITMLDSVENRQGYIKSLIRADIARANSEKMKEEETMMKYTIKPEYLDLWGSEANESTIITEEDVARFAHDWETSEDELKSQLIPVRANSERPAQNLSPVTFDGDGLTAPVFFNASARNDDDPGVPSGGNPWYAVQCDPSDDWSCGSFDLEEAKAKARQLRERYPDALVSVIDNSLENPFCTEEIRDF